ncbi:hypothetical protein K458DRAFT_381230 [Lentithecium fluviatile CBS 122367]|uniref:Uncharacterized protein n=1 Tax=Lentithecium fluviatile CBS 122367 TaxID=1168545 RepID=A0A6G1JLL3_9PLEO|nr:hypothetical protein K458DRAFT_381230 [Lentithecium fluviatile CBS 122367]
MPITSPEQCSNKVLLQRVCQLPAHLEGQPPLVRHWCQACLPPFCAKGIAVEKLREVARGEWCSKVNVFATCERCAKRHDTCLPVEPTFRRCFNILTFYIMRAKRYDATRRPEADDAWAEVHAYAVAVNQGMIHWRSEIKRLQKLDGGELEYARQRSASRENNFARYQQGLGGVGRMMPTNFVAHERMEAHFTRVDNSGNPAPGSATNRERRWYYYGPNTPDHVAPMSRDNSRQFAPGSPVGSDILRALTDDTRMQNSPH